MLHMDLKLLLEKYNVTSRKGVIHAGAHTGEEIQMYKDLGFINILAFEPLPRAFQTLNKIENVVAENLALGNMDRKCELYVASNGESSSCLCPAEHKKIHPTIKFDEKIIVDMVMLDSYLDKNKKLDAKDFNLLVMDVQGYEDRVILGARKTVASMDAIYCEISTGTLYAEATRMQDLDILIEREAKMKKVEFYLNGPEGEAFYVPQISDSNIKRTNSSP